MARFEERKLYKIVFTLTLVSETKLTDEQIKEMDLSMECQEGVAHMQIVEQVQVTEQEAARELKAMGRDSYILGVKDEPEPNA